MGLRNQVTLIWMTYVATSRRDLTGMMVDAESSPHGLHLYTELL